MPDKGKDRRTPEQVAAHYADKDERVEKKYAAKAARIEKKYKDKDKRATKAKARRLHKKGRYDYNKLSPAKKAALDDERQRMIDT